MPAEEPSTADDAAKNSADTQPDPAGASGEPGPGTAADESGIALTETGSSPYATGGGGVSLAHRIAATYLAGMLTGQRRAETFELPVRRVSFQTGPAHPVDDLLVESSDHTATASLALACRATPNFVQSDEQTVKLVGALLDEVAKFDVDTHRVGVAVAGWSNQWDQLATICDIARSHADPDTFNTSLNTDQRWRQQVRDRLTQFLGMVDNATGNSKTQTEVLQLAHKLLSRLHILGFAVQSPDDSDRTATATALDPLAGGSSDGIAVRNRLEVEATRYDAIGAVVDLNLLRRDLHSLLDTETTRSAGAWEVLAEHRRVATASVRATLGEGTSTTTPLEVTFTDRRSSLATAIQAAGTNGAALVISGESGTGKSALTLSAIAQLEADDPAGFEALLLNFRALPQTSLELRGIIGTSIADVLAELSAPSRVLVIDAADAALERSAGLLSDLVLAAKQAGVGVVAVTADTAREFVSEQLKLAVSEPVTTYTMDVLTDDDIDAVAAHFPLLRNVLRDLPATSLLRRLVALDLLVRTGTEVRSSMTEWDCLELIWSKLVRRDANPGAGSAEAREHTLLAIAAATLKLPADQQPAGVLDPNAVDALRRDHLLGPASPYVSRPEFAHDEVRRYAVAILLVRATNITSTLQAAGAPRWALSSTTLACKGKLLAPGANVPALFAGMVEDLNLFAATHGPRWADVPTEALLDTPSAYECLKAEIENSESPLTLDNVVRIVMQRHRTSGLPDPVVAIPVVRVLLDHPEPWNVSESSFELLAGWLQALAALNMPAGNKYRITLRQRLSDHWDSYPPAAPTDEDDEVEARIAELGFGSRRRRGRRALPYGVTSERYVETLALLGPDIDDRAKEHLLAIAEHTPGFLAPAVDSPLSARAIVEYDTELLATLMEAYYIDDEDKSWHRDDGVRDHQGRWKSFPPPFCQYYYGGFWTLFNNATYTTSVRVLNNILNQGARARVRILAGLNMDPFELAAIRDQDSDTEPASDEETGAELNLDGTSRLYVGDTHVWAWYRATSVGPYSAMSALLAMERIAERWLDAGLSPNRLVTVLLEGCENLAVPGLLFGLLTRHLDKVTNELDSFLAEPYVWQLEFARATGEYSGLRARTEDLKNQERRTWSPREVAMTLVTSGDSERREQLKSVAARLIANGDRLGVSQDLTKNWAASLNVDQYEVTRQGDQVYVQVNQPEELQATQAEFATYQAQVNTGMRLQSRYWVTRNEADYTPPSATEIATDLTAARELLEADNDVMPTQPVNAVAHTIRSAVQHVATTGNVDALGDETDFALRFILDFALSFRDVEDQRGEGQYFDFGADRAVGNALPALLTPALAGLLASVGANLDDVAEAGTAVAGTAPLETRLYLARGADLVWSTPCHGTPCVHHIAIGWLTEAARGAEIGDWDPDGQRRPHVPIAGDIPTRLEELDGTAIDVGMLDASIRGLGAAAAAEHCATLEARRLLARFLVTQARTMVSHEEAGWTADYRETHTLVAARALLDTYAIDHDPQPTLRHLDTLKADAGLLSGLLHGLAAVGAETEIRAEAARHLWPELLDHALTYAAHDPNPYADRHWGDWSAAALLPEPVAWTQGLYNELSGPPIEWVRAEDLLDLLDRWIPLGRGEAKCVDALIRILRKLPAAEQVTRGLPWVTNLCVRDGKAVVNQTWNSNDWLKEIRSPAEELNGLTAWQNLVDSMVVAGNEGLAPYSR